jgi:hypothetical protein
MKINEIKFNYDARKYINSLTNIKEQNKAIAYFVNKFGWY